VVREIAVGETVAVEILAEKMLEMEMAN